MFLENELDNLIFAGEFKMPRNIVSKCERKTRRHDSDVDITNEDVRRVSAKAFSKMESLIDHEDPRIQLMAASQILKMLSERLPIGNAEDAKGFVIEFAPDKEK